MTSPSTGSGNRGAKGLPWVGDLQWYHELTTGGTKCILCVSTGKGLWETNGSFPPDFAPVSSPFAESACVLSLSHTLACV